MAHLGLRIHRTSISLLAAAALATAALPAVAANAASPKIPGPPFIYYFAEGYTGPGFDEYITIQNPNGATANVTIDYQSPSGPLAQTSHQVAANTRSTVKVNNEVGAWQEVSAKVTSDQEIFVERPMYFTYNGRITGGHVVAGQTTPLTTMYFAEGYTGPGFDESLTLQNPNGTAANVDAAP